MPTTISRNIYADMYGPTTGDRVRLADTDLIVEVERDLRLQLEPPFGLSPDKHGRFS